MDHGIPVRGRKRQVGAYDEEQNQQQPTRRRPRKQATTTSSPSPQKRKQKRPDPPPPPPPALIKLLQSDPKVLAYFTSLQANLDADLNIWKERSKRYQSECQSLQAQLKEFQTVQKKSQQASYRHLHNKKRGKAVRGTKSDDDDDDDHHEDYDFANEHNSTKRGPSKSDDDDEEDERNDNSDLVKPAPSNHLNGDLSNQNRQRRKTPKANSLARPIDDSMFLLPSSDDDENEEDSEDDRKVHSVQKSQTTTFFFSSDDDDDGDNHDSSKEIALRASLPHDRNPIGVREEDCADKDILYVADDMAGDDNKGRLNSKSPSLMRQYGFLCEAHRCLAKLGVSLVSSQQPANDVEHLQHQHPQALATGISAANVVVTNEDVEMHKLNSADGATHVSCRSNQLVLQDLLQAIRTLSRLSVSFPDLAKEQDEELYSPFANESMTLSVGSWQRDRLFRPGKNESDASKRKPPHPIWQGRWYVLRALLLMDAYCDSKSENEWSEIWSNAAIHRHQQGDNHDCDVIDVDLLAVGMRDRKALVDQLLSSLHGEVTQAWALSDLTANRLQNELLQVTGDDEVDREGEGDNEREEQEQQKQAASKELSNILSHSSQNKRAALFERCILAQLAVMLHLGRGDSVMAFRLVLEYVLSATPSLAPGEYPKYPPVLSLCVLESLLSAISENVIAPEESYQREADGVQQPPWFSSFIQRTSLQSSLLVKSLNVVIHTTARIWALRAMAPDDDGRFTAIASAEVASYRRLLVGESLWLKSNNIGDSAILKDYLGAAEELSNELVVTILLNEGGDYNQLSMALTLALVFHGDADSIYAIVQDANSPDVKVQRATILLLACARATRQLNIRNLDWLQHKVGRPAPVAGISVQRISRVVADWFVHEQGNCKKLGSNPFIPLETALQCCSELADGESVLRILSAYRDDDNAESTEQQAFDFSNIIRLAETPTVRVINLQRRCDRLDAFVAQAQLHYVRIVKAVVPFHPAQDHSRFTWDNCCGGFAFDGFGKPSDVHKRLSDFVHPTKLEAFIKPTWIPSDLKAFDLNARSDETSVELSPSERACALSHIASWEGIRRSVLIAAECGALQLHSNHLLRVFNMSGFARGPPLLHANENMPPSPVYVVVEDDAIFVDRFVDRLFSVLEELPRDFHFCSLGYGRPKTAPMVKYSTHVGIPTCLWYLTGYILSKDGADYLLSNLPVRGPVDSWIGFHHICANWDNAFGQVVGVGVHSKPTTDSPSRKDLAQILKFRAFAAMVPLCSQKVLSAPSTMLAGNQRKWRQRDTDITFSGS